MARGIRNRGSQRYESKKEALELEALAKAEEAAQEASDAEEIDLEELQTRVMLEDMTRADAFARALRGER